MNELLEAIGGYGVQCSETKELAPPQYLLDAIDKQKKRVAELEQENQILIEELKEGELYT